MSISNDIYKKASKFKFQKKPTLEANIPPTNGPTILVIGKVRLTVVNALLKYSRGTVFEIKACLTGIAIDSQVPAKNAYAYTCHIVI